MNNSNLDVIDDTEKIHYMEKIREEYDDLSRQCKRLMEEGEDKQRSLLNLLQDIMVSERNQEGYEFISSIYGEINFRANDIMEGSEETYRYMQKQYRTIDEEIDEMKYCNIVYSSEEDTTQEGLKHEGKIRCSKK